MKAIWNKLFSNIRNVYEGEVVLKPASPQTNNPVLICENRKGTQVRVEVSIEFFRGFFNRVIHFENDILEEATGILKELGLEAKELIFCGQTQAI